MIATNAENITVLHPFTEDQALAWLRDRGRVRASNSSLARSWGWHRQRVARRLKAWTADGLIRRRGKSISAAQASPAVTPPAPVVVAPNDVPIVTQNDAPVVASNDAPSPASADASLRRSRVVSVILAATAIGLAAVGLAVNAQFAASLGMTTQASAMLAAIGIAIDALAVVLPSVASELWHRDHTAGAVLSWTLWAVALTMTLLATTGFSATNIGDALAVRSRAATLSSGLSARLSREHAERAQIVETRSTVEIEAAIIAARPLSVWGQTKGCTDVTLPKSAAACAEYLRLRSALGTASRRDEIEAALLGDEAALARSAAVSSDDPGARIAALWTGLSVATIQEVRIAGLTIMPATSGLLLMLASILWGRRPQKLPSACRGRVGGRPYPLVSRV